eukprot:5702492-Pyramimonas_sp.AAC.1
MARLALQCSPVPAICHCPLLGLDCISPVVTVGGENRYITTDELRSGPKRGQWLIAGTGERSGERARQKEYRIRTSDE